MIPAPFDRSQIPHKPGIYMFKNRRGELLYVGKAIDLFSRVSSYFAGHQNSFKTAKLVEEIAGIETIIVESELEALLLEANLIKKYLPPYNIRLTDDKDYLYIKITNETFPRVVTARKMDLTDAKKYFGPFPSSRTVRDTLKRLRRIFPWCNNPPRDFDPDGMTARKKFVRPCFYYHLGQCPGACIGKITPKEYQRNIHNLSLFLEGKKETLLQELQKQMEDYAKHEEFEKAQSIKKTLAGLTYLIQPNRTQGYLENPNFLEDERTQALLQLQNELNLPTLPERIECYDISNIQGHQATGSLVVLTHGEIDKHWYRKFKIIITGKPNDVGMHKEMMRRRLNHLEWPLPDLFLIDGGRGQVRGSYEELQKKNINLPIFGLAKRLEWLYPPEGEVIRLSKRSLSLRLLQKIRDEAHRFAITYHRKLRSQAFLTK